MESTFVSCFLKEGFNQNFPSFRFSFVLSSDVLILYERFFIFYGYALPLCIITNSKTFLQKAMKLELNGCKWRECSGDKPWAINVRRWSFNDECHCRGGNQALLCKISGNMCIAIVCKPGCDVMNFEVNLVFLIKPFFLHGQKT